MTEAEVHSTVQVSLFNVASFLAYNYVTSRNMSQFYKLHVYILIPAMYILLFIYYLLNSFDNRFIRLTDFPN